MNRDSFRGPVTAGSSSNGRTSRATASSCVPGFATKNDCAAPTLAPGCAVRTKLRAGGIADEALAPTGSREASLSRGTGGTFSLLARGL